MCAYSEAANSSLNYGNVGNVRVELTDYIPYALLFIGHPGVKFCSLKSVTLMKHCTLIVWNCQCQC